MSGERKQMAGVTPRDFEFIRTLLRERSAIVLDDTKQYLVETRLAPVVKEQNLASLEELIQFVRTQSSSALQCRIVEALVTTETSFFRDHHPFEALRTTVIPELMESRAEQRQLKIWCAACSTGQEPYSMALLLKEHFPQLSTWQVSLVATDISREMLTRARAGRYTQLEVNRGLPAPLLAKYFRKEGLHWQISETITRMIDFREVNLAAGWPLHGPFDIVFLRNVMIYFEVETKKQILARVARILRPDGYMILGGAESTFNLDTSYHRVESLKSGFFQLNS